MAKRTRTARADTESAPDTWEALEELLERWSGVLDGKPPVIEWQAPPMEWNAPLGKWELPLIDWSRAGERHSTSKLYIRKQSRRLRRSK